MAALVDPRASSESPWMAGPALGHFEWLTPAERPCVVLMNMLDYTLQDTAVCTGKTTWAIKSALHRGRTRLQQVADRQVDRTPLDAGDLVLQERYALRFNARDFDVVRELLCEEVRLDLVGRVKLPGKTGVSCHAGRHASSDDWKFLAGMVEGRPAIIGIDPRQAMLPPLYLVLMQLDAGPDSRIRDFRYARDASKVSWRLPPPARGPSRGPILGCLSRPGPGVLPSFSWARRASRASTARVEGPGRTARLERCGVWRLDGSVRPRNANKRARIKIQPNS